MIFLIITDKKGKIGNFDFIISLLIFELTEIFESSLEKCFKGLRSNSSVENFCEDIRDLILSISPLGEQTVSPIYINIALKSFIYDLDQDKNPDHQK